MSQGTARIDGECRLLTHSVYLWLYYIIFIASNNSRRTTDEEFQGPNNWLWI